MKEATGEANITVITIVLIAVVLAVGTVIVRRVLATTRARSCCTSVGGTVANGQCTVGGRAYTLNNAFSTRFCPDEAAE